jgi:hypothetical protein
MRHVGPLVVFAASCLACSTQPLTGPTSPLWPRDGADTVGRVGGESAGIAAPAMNELPALRARLTVLTALEDSSGRVMRDCFTGR